MKQKIPKVTEDDKRAYRAPALEKGLEIIELLAERQIPMSMTEISRDLGRSKNEIFRMLSVLEYKNYIKKQDRGEKYQITNHLFDLGMRVPPTSTLIEFIMPLMRKFAKDVKQSCHLSVLSNEHIVVIARAESPTPIICSVSVGTKRSLLESTTGNLFLAWMNKKKQAALIKRFTGSSKQKSEYMESFKIELKSIRTQGYVTKASPYIPGITDIAVPITVGDTDELIASLTTPFISSTDADFTVDETREILYELASGISKKVNSYGGF